MRSLKIEVQGVKEIAVALTKMADDISDFTPYWGDVQQEFYKIEKEAFASQGSSGKSGRWTRLTTPYAKVKFKKWGSQPILTASGALRNSLTSESANGAVVKKERDALTIGSTIGYGGYHQSGTRKMPARPPISLTENHHAQLIRKLTRQLKEAAKRNGF